MNHNITDLGIPPESELRGIGIIPKKTLQTLLASSQQKLLNRAAAWQNKRV
jgi:hypothetical protein